MANGTSSNIEAKMAEMKMKNLEILKRHREIEEDRQLAQTLSSNNNEKNSGTTMRNTTTKNRTRIISNQNYVQEQNERNQRVLTRRKFDSEPTPQRTQRKRDRVIESSHHPSMPHASPSIGPDLLEYTYPFQHQRPTNSQTEIDAPTSAKRLVLANKPATRCATGRSNQQDQRRREERMRRCLLSNNGTNEFHFDVSSMPIWSNNPPLYPPAEHLIPSTNEPIEPPPFMPNFLYPTVPFHSNGTIYFAQAPPLMANPIVPPPPPPPTTSFAPFQFVPLVSRPNDELPPRFRRLKDHDAQTARPRPISGDFERSQVRPQSFHEFSVNHRNSRFANKSLPLSAYLNPDESTHQPRRRTTNPPRIVQQEKHQFPLSLYDPRQYGFNHDDETDEANTKSMTIEEEWWQENPNDNETKTKTANVDDSGNSSLSTSIHLKESNFDEEENNLSTNDFTSLPSDVSTSDSNIIESLDKLQHDLKLEEEVEKQLENSSESLVSFTGEPPTYDTAHFMQWAKEKFREELAGRLTAQEIEEHDAVITDDDEDDDFSLPALIQQSQLTFPTLLDDEFEPIDDLKETLKKNLNLDEEILQSNGEVRLE